MSDMQAAEAGKYDSAKVWHFAEVRPGVFALYNPVQRQVELVTESWQEVLATYRSRPAYVPPVRYVEPKALRGVDLSQLTFKL